MATSLRGTYKVMKDFVVVIFLVLSAVSFYALWQGKINAGGLSLIIIALAGASAILYNAEKLKKLGAKGPGGEVLAELQDIRQDVYAKAETVRKIGEEIAELTTFAALQVGRWAPNGLQAQLLNSRNRIVSIMKEIGAGEAKISATLDRFNERVADDLRENVRKAVSEARHAVYKQAQAKGQEPPFDPGVVDAEVRRRLATYIGSEQDRLAFLEYLENQQLDVRLVTPALDALDYFLKTGRLKPGIRTGF